MRPQLRIHCLLLLSLLQCSLLPSLHAKSTLQHTQQSIFRFHEHDTDEPQWNLSPLIDDDGFLTQTYTRIPGDWEIDANIRGRHGPRSRNFRELERVGVRVRQVPGDGNCLFHSLSAGLCWAESGKHVSMRRTSDETMKEVNSTSPLEELSKKLRHQAVDMLSNHKRQLYLHGSEYLRCEDLVEAAATQYNVSTDGYCDLMRKDSYWGGGPEIVALVNVLKRPIHVYELCTVNCKEEPTNDDHPMTLKRKRFWHRTKGSGKKTMEFRLRRISCFGSPKFDNKTPLSILSADSRFPDVKPGKHLDIGNHFLAIMPSQSKRSGFFRRKVCTAGTPRSLKVKDALVVPKSQRGNPLRCFQVVRKPFLKVKDALFALIVTQPLLKVKDALLVYFQFVMQPFLKVFQVVMEPFLKVKDALLALKSERGSSLRYFQFVVLVLVLYHTGSPS